MSKDNEPVNSTIAPLSNVVRFTELVEHLVSRPLDLPGFGVFAGRAGIGKTFSAIYAINKYRAHYVECDDTWTKKALCEAIMVDTGLLQPRTPMKMQIYRAVGEIGDYLADNPKRPLIIDEADFLVKRGMIEIARAIYKHCAAAGSSIILIGEEGMPRALKMWERVDSRVLRSEKAEPINIDDVKILADMICRDLSFDSSAYSCLKKESEGSARRLVTLLHNVKETAGLKGWEAVTADLLDAD